MPLAPQEIRTFFVTTVTANRRRLFQVTKNAELFLDVLQENRAKGRFHLHAFVIMPDHVHLLFTPTANVSLEKSMQYIKGGFSFRLKSSFDVWEKSFQEHRIKDAHDYNAHTTYIEQNPIRANLASHPHAYAFSSASSNHILDEPPIHLANGWKREAP